LGLEPLEDRVVPAPVPPPSGLVSWWTGDNTAADLEGLNNGTLYNGTTYAPGEVASAFSFNGTDYVSANTSGLPTGNSDRSMEMWVYVNAFGSGESYFAGYGAFGSYNQTYHLGTNPTDHKLFFSQWGQGFTGPVLQTGQWYHIAVTNVGNTATLYLNGSAVSSGTLTIDTPQNAPFYIGRIPGSLGDIRQLNGMVDEVSVYNRALTADEVQAIYNAGSDGKIKDVGVTAAVVGTTLQVTGDSRSQAITLRLKAGDPATLEVDVGNDGTADFSLARSSFSSIVLDGGGGNDTLRIDESNGVFTDTQPATLLGGAGNDTLVAGSAGETFDGGTGTDTLVGPDASNDWILTGPGAGTLDGMSFSGMNNLTGGSQQDVFTLQPGGTVSGTLNGGAGTADQLDYASYGGSVTVNLQTRTAPGMGHFTGIESFSGSTASDTLIGPNAARTWKITGDNAGLVGTVAFNSFENLTGGTGNDTFLLGNGQGISGVLDGGGGTNTLSYAAYTSAVAVALADSGLGTASNIGGGVANLQNVTGGAGNDTLTGNAGDNILMGGAGNDVLSGGAGGNDILVGGAGNDTLTAGSGRSLLIGGHGADHLSGGAADDLLIAGYTGYDTNSQALLALMKEWKRTDADYATRIAHLRGTLSGGLNGSFDLTSSTVHSDTAVDTLTGAAGQDWFWANLSEITDRDPSEQVN
jgi:hypothetical protein